MRGWTVAVVVALGGCAGSAGSTPSEDAAIVPDVAEEPDVEILEETWGEDTPTGEDSTAEEDSTAAEDTGPPLPESLGPVPVPGNGWVEAVVDSNVPASLAIAGAPTVNLASDPQAIVGPPEGELAGLVAVGVEGHFVVSDFGEGDEAHDGDGADIVVVEYGLLAGGVDEPYRVSVSDAPDGPFVGLGDGQGERGFDLGAIGVASARYVRVESLATLDDVAAGAGSPSYPGPEIDAIGAVYPGGAEPGQTPADLVVSGFVLSEDGGDGKWVPGDTFTIEITLTNEGEDDFGWYPGVRLESDHPDVTIEPQEVWFYALAAGQSLEAEFAAILGPDVPAQTTVAFVATAVAQGCEDPSAVVPCPDPGELTFELITAGPIMACCSVSGVCSSLTEKDCAATPDFHSWNPVLTCGELTCPDETQGACCLDDGTCEDGTTVDACIGGTHGGQGSTCAEVDCPGG